VVFANCYDGHHLFDALVLLSGDLHKMNYNEFLAKKQFIQEMSGFDVELSELNEKLFDFQKTIVKWALKRGKAAIFADTGLGKTFMQVEWAWNVFQRTGNRVLILTPLSVADQTVAEADKLGYSIKYVREFNKDGSTGIYVTNYEMLHEFEDAIREGYFDGIVLDESSCIKHENTKTRQYIVDLSRHIPYRLSCTATPSPNDYMELGNQAEFLGIMRMTEMLSMFFIHDSGETSKWRLKGHGRKRFWAWLATWACVIKRPSDIGFSDEGYNLPPLDQKEIVVPSQFNVGDTTGLAQRNEARKISIDERVAAAAALVNNDTSGDSWVVWCNLNDESKKLTEAIVGAIEVKGSDSIKHKEQSLADFASQKSRVIVTKPSIAGFGLNWQHCHKMIFVGLNDSFEQLYQAIRRCYRFGQTKPVQVYLVSSVLEGPVLENLKKKELMAEQMSQEMVEQMRDFTKKEIRNLSSEKTEYTATKVLTIPAFLGGKNEYH
jgi:SNF2 family DNA or RNA helicase